MAAEDLLRVRDAAFAAAIDERDALEIVVRGDHQTVVLREPSALADVVFDAREAVATLVFREDRALGLLDGSHVGHGVVPLSANVDLRTISFGT
jgi:hypothetical protein